MATPPTGIADPTAMANAMRYGAPVQQAAQRSQYLAQALQQLQESSQAPRSYGELGARLLAQALLQSGRKDADTATMKAIGDQQKSRVDAAFDGAPTVGAASPAAPVMPTAPAGSAAAPAVPQAPAAPAQVAGQLPADVTQLLDSGRQDMMARLLVGEAGNQSDTGQQAVAAVVQNRAKASGMSPEEVMVQKGQFEPFGNAKTMGKLLAMGTGDPAYQRAMGNGSAILGGAPDPTGGADHFYSPGAQAALGRPMPSWDNGTGQMIGDQKFLQLNPSNQGPPPPQGQLAMNGQVPPGMLSSGAGLNAPSVAPPAGANPPVAAPAGASAVPHNYVDPAEWSLARDMANSPDPQVREQGIARGWALKEKAAGNPDPSKPYFSADGQAHFAPGMQYQDVASSPNQFVQRGPDGKIVSTGNAAYGSLPSGTQMSQSGQIQAIQGGQPRTLSDPRERASYGISANDQNAYFVGPDGKVMDGPKAPLGVDQVLAERDKYLSSDEHKNALIGIGALNSLHDMFQKARGNNGVLDMAVIDNLVKAQTGLSARQGNVQLLMSHLGLPQEVQGKVLSITGNGAVTPDVLRDMESVLSSYATTHRDIASERLNNTESKIQQLSGGHQSLGLSIPNITPMPNVAWMQGRPPQAPSTSQSELARAAQAELDRRHAAGLLK